MTLEVEGKAFKVIEKKKYLLLSLLNATRSEDLEEFQSKMMMLLEVPINLIINCACLTEISDEWVSMIKTLKSNLMALGKNTSFVFLSDEVRTKIEKCYSSKNDLEIYPGLLPAIEQIIFEPKGNSSSGAMLIKSFVMATIKTIMIQGKTMCHRQPLVVKKTEQNTLDGDYSGIINITCSRGKFSILLSFPKETLLKLLTALLGEKVLEISQENRDGVTEILNIIYGQAKMILNTDDVGLKFEIPVLIPGNNYLQFNHDKRVALFTDSLEKGHNIVVPFTSDLGPFNIRFWFQNFEIAQSLLFNKS